MLKRPSSRRKSHSEQISLNLVPILDTMVTLIGFMLFTMSFVAIVSIESPVPITSQKAVDEKLVEKPLQLTVTVRENEIELWSPFERIPPRKIPSQTPGQPDIKALHEAVLGIKQQFPNETNVVLAPFAAAPYDVLVAVMDALRDIETSDPPIYAKNEQSGNDEVVKALFPNIVFGNILGDTVAGSP